MKVVILSGGMGRRLRPITDYLPKPLVPIGGIPVIEWQINYFKKFGIKDFVICAGYRADQIISHLKSKKLEVKIQFSVETTPLGTGGAIKNAKRYIDDDFFVINGDVITNLDPTKLQNSQNSLAVMPLRTTFGIVHLEDNKIERFEEKPELHNYWMNAGIYYLEKDTLKYLPKVGNIESITFPKLAEKGQLHAVKYQNVFWYSIDSHKDMEECMNSMKKTKYEKFLMEV